METIVHNFQEEFAELEVNYRQMINENIPVDTSNYLKEFKKNIKESEDCVNHFLSRSKSLKWTLYQ